MKTFLKVDLGVQIVCYLLVAAGVTALIAFNNFEFFICSFFILGGWQLLSAMGIMLWRKKGGDRKNYFLTAIIYLFLLFPIVMVVPLVYLSGAFLISIWHFKITYNHFQNIRYHFRSFWDLEF